MVKYQTLILLSLGQVVSNCRNHENNYHTNAGFIV